MRTFLRAAAPIMLLTLLVPATSAGGTQLRSCDLGLQRPFRCGHLVVPMRRSDPALGTTRVAFAVRTRSDRGRPSLGTIVAMDGVPATPRARRPTLARWSRCWRRCCAAAISSSSTSAAPAAPTSSTANRCSAG